MENDKKKGGGIMTVLKVLLIILVVLIIMVLFIWKTDPKTENIEESDATAESAENVSDYKFLMKLGHPVYGDEYSKAHDTWDDVKDTKDRIHYPDDYNTYNDDMILMMEKNGTDCIDDIQIYTKNFRDNAVTYDAALIMAADYISQEMLDKLEVVDSFIIKDDDEKNYCIQYHPKNGGTIKEGFTSTLILYIYTDGEHVSLIRWSDGTMNNEFFYPEKNGYAREAWDKDFIIFKHGYDAGKASRRSMESPE